MKRILTTILSVIMLFAVSMFVLTACDGCGEKITDKPQEQIETYINLSLAEKQMIVGDEETLVAYTPVIDDLTITWASSDERIVSVNNGVITAVRPGTADITATFGDKTDSCKVTVVLGSQVPVIEFENQIVNDNLYVAKNGDVNLGAFIKFNNKIFNDATFTYTVVSGDSVGTVDATGKFVAGATNGSAVVEVKASWREIDSPELTRLITINVISNYVILIDQGMTNSIELYTSAVHGGRTFSIEDVVDGRIIATEDGVDMTSTLTISVTNQVAGNGSTARVVDYDDATKKITALTYGTADLVLSFTTSEGQIFTTTYPINVNRPVAVYEDTIEYFSALDGELDVNAIFGRDVTLLDAYQYGDDQTGTSLKVVDNKVLNLFIESTDSMEEQVITIYDDTVGYQLSLEAYTKVIDTYSDFASFHGKNDVTGYVVLKNDIEFDDSLDNLADSSAAFVGVFDGNGHYVNVRTIKNGLFNGLRKATIKNVAFIVEEKGEKANRFILASKTSGDVLFKDVLFDVNVAYTNSTNYSIAGENNMATTDYINVIVDSAPSTLVYDFKDTTTHKYGGLFESYTASAWFTKQDTDFDGDGKNDNRFNYDSFQNTYYINSDYKLVGWYNGGNAGVLMGMYFAENDAELYLSVKDTVNCTTFGFYKGLLRYDNYGAMKAAGNDYSSFNPEVWDLTSGVPQFKSLQYSDDIQMPAEVELTAGVKDTETISAFIFGSTDTATYTSTDTNVVTVDANGLVTAVGIGTAEIKATIGDKTATCIVTVGWVDGTEPVLSIPEVVVEPVIIGYGETPTFTAVLTYNGASVEGLIYTWSTTVEGGSFADATVGTFTAPDSYKTGIIKAVVKYYNQEFYCDFDVQIAPDPGMQVNGEAPADVLLYTDATWGGDYTVETAFEVTSTQGFTVESIVSEDTSIATYDETTKKLKSVGVGETYVSITFKLGEVVATKKVKVVVNASIKAIDTVLNYSELDGEIRGIEATFEEGTNPVVIYRATQNGEELTVSEGNIITGIYGGEDANAVGSAEVIVYAGNKAVKLTVNTYKMVIDEAEDFTAFAKNNSIYTDGVKKGYFILANDITLEGSTWAGNSFDLDDPGSEFQGVLDGNGFSAEIKVKTNGLFGKLSKATIKNIAIIVKDIGVNSAGATVFGQQFADSSIIDTYVSYDIPATKKVDASIYGHAQTSGLGLYIRASKGVTIRNTVVDMSNVELKTGTNSKYYAYGTIFTKADPNVDAPVLENVYVVSPIKELTYLADVTAEGNTVSSFNGDRYVMYATNDDEALEGSAAKTKVPADGVKRYDSFSAFAEDKENNDFSMYNAEIWDFESGFPIFKTSSDRFEFYYLGGSSTATAAKLSSEGEGESIEVYASVKGVSYKAPAIEVIEGSEFITVEGNVIKAVPGMFGFAKLKVTYTIEGKTEPVEKVYTIAVLGAAYEGEAIKYSTLDDTLYFDEGISIDNVKSIVSSLDGTVYYEAVENDVPYKNIPQNTDSNILSDNIENCIITLKDGTKYTIDLISYTKIITKSSDFALFRGANGTAVGGYYIVANNITLDGSWEGNDANSDKRHKFTGVFDGQGHTVEVALKASGVFGSTEGATIKNTAFVVKQLGAQNFAHASILAYSMMNTTVSNCYFTYDLPAGTTIDVGYYGWGQSSGLGLYATGQVGAKLENVIIDTSSVELANVDKAFAYGSIMTKANGSQSGVYVTKTNNVYVISNNKYMAYQADYTADGATLTGLNGIKYAFFASNDTEAYEACEVVGSGAKYSLAGTKRYDSFADIVKDKANNDYSSFNECWEIDRYGFPTFKTMTFSDEVQMTTTLSLTAGVKDTATLSATILGSTEAPVFSCEANNGVITVDANTGLVTAIGIGQATVTATIGTKTATCLVTVDWANGTAPTLAVDGITEETELVYAEYGETVDFTARLMYNGAEVSGITYNWTSTIAGVFADASVGTFTAPATYAEGAVRVVVTYYGAEFYYDFNVQVAGDPEMKVNGAKPVDVELYTDATWGAAEGTINKVEDAFVVSYASDVTLVSIVSGDTNVVTYDATNQKLVSVGPGETFITITFTDVQNNTISRKVKVVVNASIKEIEEVLDYSALDGEIIGVKQYFEEDGEVVIDKATLDGEALEVTDGKIYGIDADSKTVKTKEVIVTSGSKAVKVSVNVYKMLIDETDDMKVFQAGNNEDGTGKELKGYFKVVNDIKLEGSSWTGNTCSDSKPHKFSGTFDGDGHIVEVALKKYGIFGTTNGATIKNTAFIVKQLGAKSFAYASILGYSIHSTTVSNCYFEYDLPVGTAIATDYSGFGQSSGFGVYASSSASVKFVNVVIDTSKAELANTEGAFAYGALMSKADNSQSGAYITKTTDVYVIGTNKYLGYRTSSSPTPGSTSGTISGITGIAGVWFAENDTEAYNAQKDYDGVTELADTVKKQIAGTKRYDNVTAFAADAENNDYTSFDANLWDTTAGYPVFKGMPAYNLINNINKKAEFYIGGNKNTVEANLENTNNTGLTLYASFETQTYTPTLSLVSGEGLVTIADNVIKPVANAMGTATVKAVYDIEGIIVEKTYTVNVTLEMLNGNVMFSTIDNDGLGKIYFPDDSRLEGKTITSIIDLSDQTIVYYENGAVTDQLPKNTDSKDLTDYTKSVIITLDNGLNYSTNLISYTKVLTKADDLSVFAHANTTDVVSGYYIVANDITLEGSTWAGNAHYRDWQVSGTFDGVFDGNGHCVELKLNYGGLLGVMAPGSVVKDVAFIVKEMKTTGSNAGNVIANKTTATNANKLIVENVYVEWDLPENTVLNTAHNGSGQDFGLALFGEQPYYSKISNVVIDMTGVTKQTGSLDFRYGALYAKINSAAGATWADNVLSNVYVISQDKYFALNRTYTGATVNDVYAAVHFAGNDTEALAEFKAANSTVEKAFAYSSVKRYDSVDAFAKATGNDYSLFTGVWDTTLGYPVFKSMPAYNLINDINKKAEYYIGGNKNTVEVNVENTNTTGLNVYASFESQTYTPTLTLVDGEGIVTVDDVNDVIYVVANAMGTATVEAVYDIEGIIVEKTYTINVTLEMLNGNIMFSTVDNDGLGKLYFPEDSKLDGQTVKSIYNLNDKSIVYYEDSAITDVMPKNVDSSDLTDYTVNVIVELENGKTYSTTLVSYTKVLTTAQDFTIFNIETETTIINGYYVLGNDITTKEEVFFTHHGIHAADAENNLTATNAWNYTSAGFAGTFDGLGHKVTMNVKGSIGIFGQFLAGARVQNVAFYDMTIGSYRDNYATNAAGELITKAGGGKESWNTLLAQCSQGNTTTVYITDVFAEITEISEKGTWGSGLISNPGYINLSGVMVRFTPTIGNLHGAVTAYNVPSSSNTHGLIVVTTQNLARNGTNHWVGINETLETEGITYIQVANAYRYADYVALGNDTANHQAMYATFSRDIWDFTKDFPIFKGLEDRVKNDMIASAEYYLGGGKNVAEADMANTEDTSIDVYAHFDGQDYEPTSLTIVDGNPETDVITVSGNTITVVANAVGKANVKATYEIMGITVEKVYTIKVIPQDKAGRISYSTLDNAVYFSDELKDDQIEKIVELGSGKTYYENGAATSDMLENTDTTDLAEKTQKVVVFLNDGTSYGVELVSYTMVLTKADDFAVFNSTTKDTVINGYYILGNDITLEGATWTGNASEVGGAPAVAFKGVFDGNGHYAEIALKKYGIFGSTEGATIKNTAFIVKQIGSKTFAYASILAYSMATSTVSNCYFEYDLPVGTKIDVAYDGSGQSSGLGLYASQSHLMKLQNSVINTSKVELENVDTAFAYGSIMAKATNNIASGTGSGTWMTQTTNVYVISTIKYLAYRADTSTGDVQAVWYASNDEEAFDADTNSSSIKKQPATTYRFDTYLDMPTTANSYSSFDTSVWNFTNGYPIFNAYYNQINKELVSASTTFSIGGSEGTEAEIVINDEATELSRSVNIVATYRNTPYYPTNLVVAEDGDAFVTVSSDYKTVTAKEDADSGETTVTATFNIAGAILTKTFTIKITVPVVSSVLDGEVYYSEADGFVFTKAEYNNLTVSKVTSVDESATYYENETATADIINNSNTKSVKDVVVTFSDTTKGSIKLTSATKVITKAEDLKLLIDTTGADVTGYFLLANDIDVKADTSYTPVAGTSEFKGTFDGNGHTLTDLIVGTNGLIGGAGAGGKIVNLGITVDSTFESLGLIANSNSYGTTYNGSDAEENLFVVDNCYIDINSDWIGNDTGVLFNGNPYLGLRMRNTIIDVEKGKFTAAVDGVKRGIIFNGLTTQYINNGDGNYKYFGKRSTTNNYELFSNCYYVSSDYGYIIANGLNSSAGKRALVCENDTTLADTASGTFTAGVGLTVGINRYTSIADVPNTEGVITNVSWKVVENAIVWNA